MFEMKKIIFIISFLLFNISFSQNRLVVPLISAIKKGNTTSYNYDGVDFYKEETKLVFNKKNIKRILKEYRIKKKERKIIDTILNPLRYRIIRSENTEEASINFIKNENNLIDVFAFSYFGKNNIKFENEMISISNKIPVKEFESYRAINVNFINRKLELGGNCSWMSVNNIQCPGYGQMNWSVHKTSKGAQNAIDNQLNNTKSKKGTKIISEEFVDIIFENVPTKSKKIILKITGLNGSLVSLTGGKYLTIYYVQQKIRGNYVSCVLSFWNNDNINESGLPSLLEEVMSLKTQ